jgi:hypothetical protein
MVMANSLAAVALVVVVLVLPSDVPLDVPDQCDQPTFARANPGLCGDSSPYPPFPGSGPPGDGGLIGGIARVLHGLTGGLL